MKRFYSVAFVLYTIVGIGNAFDTPLCCPEGQTVHVQKQGVYSCWDPKTEATSQISLKCDKFGYLLQSKELNLVVGEELVVQMNHLEVTYERNKFCMARKASPLDRTLTRRMAVICYEEESVYITDSVYGYLLVVSVIFLVGTAGVYVSRADFRDLLSKCIISFCLSMATGLGILAGMKLVPYSDMNLCAVRGFLAYYFLIASFFWMNGIAVQIGLAVVRKELDTNIYRWDKYLCYALYAWGTPAIMTAMMAVINFMPGDHLRPGIGLNHCWFFDVQQQWQYMYSTLAVIIICNFCIFVYTSIHLSRNSCDCAILKNKFWLMIQMFVIVGVPWTLEMITSLVKTNLACEIANVIISLQGLPVFVVLVLCRRRTPPTHVGESYFTPPSLQYIYNITIDQPYSKMAEEKH